MRRKWIAIFLSLVMTFSVAGQALAEPIPIRTSCGVAQGTASSPHKICNAEDLKLMGVYPEHHYFLNNGVTVGPNWTPIPYFSGTLNGNNQSITGLQNSLIQENYGNIKNMNLKYVSIFLDYRGAFAFSNYGYLYNVKVYGEIGGYGVGGIASYNGGVIEESTSDIATSGKSGTGGIVSKNGSSGVIKNSYFSGHAGAFAQAGGVAAYNEGRIENVIAWGTVSVVSGGAGGIVAHNSPTGIIVNTKATGTVYYMYEPILNVGRIAGLNQGNLINCLGLNQVLKQLY